MNEISILKITSSTNTTIGTGFVIACDEDGAVVATCSHVVSACKKEALLVEGMDAFVQEDFADEGLDMALLYVKERAFTNCLSSF